MRTTAWLVAALVVAGGVYTTRGCLNQLDPDQKLAAQLGDLCEVARDNMKSPEQGVRELGRYLLKHGSEMSGELVSTIAMIERIDDDRSHDKRAELARDRLHKANCGEDWERFMEAVDADPNASELVEHHIQRLMRTLEIILSGAKLDLRHWPQQLDSLF